VDCSLDCYDDGSRQASVSCSQRKTTGERRNLPKNIENLTDHTNSKDPTKFRHEIIDWEAQEIAAAFVSDLVTRVGSAHKELSEKRFRRLEELLDKIVRTSECHCEELKKVLRGFEKFQSALMPCLIWEQYLFLPTIGQKLAAESAGTVYSESYAGEIEDMIRTAGADHHQLQFLAQQLVKDIQVLTEKGHCPSVIRSFGALFDEFCETLRNQFALEDTVLLQSHLLGRQGVV
jgi:iron-sulfur cluster repair protein YtfE (RIC family)